MQHCPRERYGPHSLWLQITGRRVTFYVEAGAVKKVNRTRGPGRRRGTAGGQAAEEHFRSRLPSLQPPVAVALWPLTVVSRSLVASDWLAKDGKAPSQRHPLGYVRVWESRGTVHINGEATRRVANQSPNPSGKFP